MNRTIVFDPAPRLSGKAALVAAALLASAGEAARADELTVGLGAATVPDTPGADSNKVIPFGNFFYESDTIRVRTSGLGLQADVVPSKGLDAGPVIRFDLGRDDDVRDPVVRLLPKVGTAVELGGFMGTGIPITSARRGPPTLITFNLTGTHDVASGHGGTRMRAATGIFHPLKKGGSAIVQLGAGWTSAAYNRAYFGVTPAGALASGLAAYQPGSGISDAGVTSILTLPVSGRWSLSGIASYSRLLGPAARSPIVTQRGSRNQIFAGTTLNYRIF